LAVVRDAAMGCCWLRLAAGIIAIMEERHGNPPTAYPVPEATVAVDPNLLVAIVAAIVGVLFFWRRKKNAGPAR